MQREDLKILWPLILTIYLISFYQPVGNTLGIEWFVAGMVFSLGSPIILLHWVANPLLWLGVFFLRGGRWGLVAFTGTLACISASLMLFPVMEHRTILETARGLGSLVGYFVWLASTVLLAATGWIGWLMPLLLPRPRRRGLVVLIGVVAATLAYPRLLRWLILLLSPPLPRW